MAELFFSLRGVPEDEAEDVRELLTDSDIDFYETPAGNWGVSLPAIWIKHEDDLSKASELLQEYQRNRYTQQRALYKQLKKEGKNRRLLNVIQEKPLEFLLYTAFMVFITYISVKWLFELGL